MKTKHKKQKRPNLFGFHAVREAWLNPDRDIEQLLITQDALRGFEKTVKEAQQQGCKRPQPTITEKNQLDAALPRGAVHQGLALIVEDLEEYSAKDLIIKAQDQTNSLILMLDQITDPHNVGAILRSASGFQADGVVMQHKHAPRLDGVLAKTASGGVEHMPVATETNLSRALEELKDAGYFVYGLDERGEQTIDQMKPGGKVVLVLGAEGPGIRRLIKEHCDALLRLPTSGPIASLNVSNAAAIALYALTERK